MPLNYYECFGVPVTSSQSTSAFQLKNCPFVTGKCTKAFSSGFINGACTLINPSNNTPVPCCPKRLYGDNYRILSDVVRAAWGEKIPLILENGELPHSGKFVIPFGQKQGHEIRIPYKALMGASKFSIDWILALVDENRDLAGFVAVEVQTIDTTGNYRRQYWDLAQEHDPKIIKKIPRPPASASNLNFENVNKRILPQLITKGHVLRRENLCTRGLFFICPTAVYERIIQRVGKLDDYPIQTGSITFLSYSIDETSTTIPKSLRLDHTSTTTTDQLSLAFSSPKSLPPQGVYEHAIRVALAKRLEES
ncbi:MAG: NotI family restriction endonuclease [Verrucomicrobiota bacterium]